MPSVAAVVHSAYRNSDWPAVPLASEPEVAERASTAMGVHTINARTDPISGFGAWDLGFGERLSDSAPDP